MSGIKLSHPASCTHNTCIYTPNTKGWRRRKWRVVRINQNFVQLIWKQAKIQTLPHAMSRIGPMLIRGFRAAKQWKSSVHPECATSPSQINSIRSPYQKTEERMEVLISIIICSLSQVNPFPLHLLSRSKVCRAHYS